MKRGERQRAVSFRLPPATYDAIATEAARCGLTVTAILKALCAAYLRRQTRRRAARQEGGAG